ncbi:MAG TPA: uroporphyrinogen decarboxylase [Gemmatimonadales bacterium]|nr:uroporphyrinogen decarboxylase [Gemmatimonadales bacterium]
MRQAGRYMPQYRKLRKRHSILELCHRPELSAEVTLQPVEHLGVDAAIIFADILLPFEPLRLGLRFEEGEGPKIDRPIRDATDVERLPEFNIDAELGYVCDAIRLARRALPAEVPLIGFAGAPFTLASYAIEGGASRTFTKTKQLMYQAPDTWHLLMKKLADMVGAYLAAQARAGAQALQLFDSWVGCLSPDDYRTYVAPHSRRALSLAGAASVPLIHFGTGTATFLEDFAGAGGDVISIDWRIPIDAAWARIGARAIQGNLEPVALLAPEAERNRQVRDILKRAGGRPGHIFNLGHGVLPETDVAAVRAVVDLVHDA